MDVIDQVGDVYPFSNEEKEWADMVFQWFTDVYEEPWGQPWIDNEENFPELHADTSDNPIDSVIADFCSLLEISREHVSYEIILPINDGALAIASSGNFLDCQLQIDESSAEKLFVIGVPAELKRHQKYLLYKMSLVFTQIVLEEHDVSYYHPDHTVDDINDILHIGAAYFSLGLIVAKHGEQIGTDQYGRWNYPMPISGPLYGYILGLWSEQLEFDDRDWIHQLPERIKHTYLQYKLGLSSHKA